MSAFTVTRALVLSSLLAAAGGLAVGVCGCHTPAPGGDAPAIDEKLMVALDQARAWQHRADVHLADGDAAEAERDVAEVLRIPFPAGTAEGEEARLDAWARLAKLHAATDETQALGDVDHGRREATHDSFFRAHLEMVAGEIYEARGKRIAATDGEGAKAARRDALAAYARSIEIDKRVQAELLKETRP